MKPDLSRRIRWLLAAAMLCVIPAVSQPEPAAIGRAAAARLDLAVPDAPAYGALGRTPDIIMRPGSVREVSAMVTQLLGAGTDLPRSIGVELAPALLLAGNDLTLRQYTDRQWLYRVRISAASSLDRGNHREAAVGLRIALFDGTDLRTDDSLHRELLALAGQVREAWEEAVETIRPPSGEFDETELQDKRERLVRKKLGSQVERRVVAARTQAERRLWNRRILEAGVAVKAGGADSTLDRLHAERYAVWLTGGLPLGTDGLLLAGCNGTLENTREGDPERVMIGAALRVYYGTNAFKGSLEGNGNWVSHCHPEYAFLLGGEFRVGNGFWADLSVGVAVQGDGDALIKTSFGVRIATPEERSDPE